MRWITDPIGNQTDTATGQCQQWSHVLYLTLTTGTSYTNSWQIYLHMLVSHLIALYIYMCMSKQAISINMYTLYIQAKIMTNVLLMDFRQAYPEITETWIQIKIANAILCSTYNRSLQGCKSTSYKAFRVMPTLHVLLRLGTSHLPIWFRIASLAPQTIKNYNTISWHLTTRRLSSYWNGPWCSMTLNMTTCVFNDRIVKPEGFRGQVISILKRGTLNYVCNTLFKSNCRNVQQVTW